MAVHEGYRPYGGKVEDFLVGIDAVGAGGEEVLVPAASATVTIWDAGTGGSQITDLLDDAGAVITQVTADDEGALPRFYAPDSYTEVFVDGGGTRRQALPADVGEAGTGSGAVDSVNGETGTVVLGASDVGAAPTSHTHQSDDITDLFSGVLKVLTGKVANVRIAVSVTFDGTSWPTVPSSLATSDWVQMQFMDFTGDGGVPTQGRSGIDIVAQDSSGV